MTLTEFLLARIAEDERHARKLAEADRRPVLSLALTVNHPGRLLLECDAKRRIVGEHGHETSEYSDGVACVVCSWNTSTGGMEYEPNGWCATLRSLALPYADHDDYDETWHP